MSDFEMCPIGTQARLAAIELVLDRAEQCAETEAKRADKAEAESRRLSDVVSLANRRSDHLGIRLGEVIAERDALLSLIADDAFASSFQTMAQYRSALLKATKGGGNG